MKLWKNREKQYGGIGMKKKFKVIDLDCANCANKMQEEASKVEGVINVQVNFLMQTMTLEAEDEQFESVLKNVIKACKKVEPDCEIEAC